MSTINRLLHRVTTGGSAELLHADGPDGARWFSCAQIDALSSKRAAALAERGVRPGDRVAAYCENSLELVLAFLGCWRLGAVWVPINPGYQRAELDHILDDATPTLVLTDAPLPDRPSLPLTQLAASDGTVPKVAADGDALALLIYTSGTTGKSKGCMLTANNVVDATEALMDAWGMTDRDVLVHALPLFHVHGLCVALCGALLSGARVRLLPRFSTEAVLSALHDDGTVFMGVPTMYRRLLDQPDVSALSEARLLCSGSAPLPAHDFDEVLARTGQRVVERYGMSETLITLSNPLDPHEAREPGSVGRPIAGVQIRVVDGELWVKGPGVMRGYWNSPIATAATFEDGWLKTGDAVTVGDDGAVRILGRVSTDFVKVGGYKVATREIEDALATHPQVAEVAVVGVPDREWGERVVACVVPRGLPPTQQELFDHVQLHASKKPRGLLILDALPRNAMGKVQKKALVERAAQQPDDDVKTRRQPH